MLGLLVPNGLGCVMGRTTAKVGLVAFSGVLATDQIVKAAGAAARDVQRVLAVDSAMALAGVAAFLLTSAVLMWIARSGAVSPISVGLVLGGLASTLLDALATGATAGISLADVAVGVGVLLGLAQTLLHRPAIFGRPQRLVL